MAEEIVKVIKIETAGGQQTVKGLRDEIKSLRDDLLNVDKGTKEYDEILGKLINDEKQLTDVMRAGKNEVSAATGSYNALQNEMTALRKVWKEVTDEAQRVEIGARINELNQELKDLDASIGNNQRKVGSYEEALKSVTSQYTSQRAELKALRVELENLEPGTEAYNQAFSRAAEITANVKQQQELLKYASNDLGDQLSNIRGIAANMAAGFSAAQAAIGLFGGESEEVQQAMLKVQQAMALVQGLEGLDGFIKRTQGLSTAIQNWIAQSKTATVQTTAQATATKAAAAATNAETVAKQAETVATEGATVAQKGLNAAMKSNPIGFIIGLLALLVANWEKVTEWLGKAVGGWDKVTKAMNKFKATISGVAKAISKVLLVPIKEAINYVVTLGKVLKDVFTLNWSEIGNDIKDGINNSVNIVKDGYDVAANYAKGKEEEITRQQKEEARKRAEERADELEKVIELKKAQNGSDWEYSEEGQAVYKEYFAKLEEMYKGDAEKYHEYQVQKANYERELADYNDKKAEDAKKKEEERRKKATEAAKKARERLEKIEQDYHSNVEKYSIGSYKDAVKAYKESIDAMIEYYEGKVSPETLKLFDFKDAYGDIKEEMLAFFKGLDSLTENQYGFNLFKFYVDENGSREDYKKFLNLTNKEMKDAIRITIDDGEEFYKQKMQQESLRMLSLNNALINDAIHNSGDEARREINNQILQIFEKNIRPKVSDEIARLQNEIDKQTIKLDFEIETGFDADKWIDGEELVPIENFDKRTAELERATAVYQNAVSQLLVQKNYYAKTAAHAEENGYINSDEYEQAIIQVEAINNQLNQLHEDYYRTNAEIRDRYFAEDLQKIQTNAEKEERLVELNYNKKYAGEGKWNEWYLNGRRELSGTIMKYDIQAAEERYQIQKNSLEEQLAMYQSYLSDVTVAGEQRVEAEKMVAELIAQIEEGEVAHTRDMNQLRIQSFQMWYSYAQEAIGSIGDLFGGLADYYEADIKAKQANNELSEEEANEMYEKVKALKISEAIISTISGAIGAFMQAAAAYPPPYGEILGGISAAAITAAGVAQIAQIKQQNLGSNGGSIKAIATPQTEVYQPEYTENPTTDNEISNLRNAYMNQPIKAYVVESEITDSQKRASTRDEESTF